MAKTKILIANDIESRIHEIKEFIIEKFDDLDILEASSYKDTLKYLTYKKFDCIILDITMPTYYNKEKFSLESGTFRSLAGLNILERMYLDKLNIPTILFSGLEKFYDEYNFLLSFKQLTKSVEKYSFCKGIIRDNGEQILWQKEMQELLNNIIRK